MASNLIVEFIKSLKMRLTCGQLIMSLPARISSQIYPRLCVCTSPRAEHGRTFLWPTLLPWPDYLHSDHSPWWRFFVLLRVHMMDIMMMILRSTDLTLAHDVIQVHTVMIIRHLPVIPLPDLTLGSKPLSVVYILLALPFRVQSIILVLCILIH